MVIKSTPKPADSIEEEEVSFGPEEPRSIEKRVTGINVAYIEKAKELALKIIDQKSFDAAGEFLVHVAGFKKKTKAAFRDVKAKAKAAHAAVCDLETKALRPLVEAEGIVNAPMAKFYTEQQRLQRIERERLQKEEEDREREARRKAAVHAKANAPKVAEAIVKQAPAQLAPVVTRQVTKTKGVSITEKYFWEVYDTDAFIKAVAEGVFPPSVLRVSMTDMNGVANTAKGTRKDGHGVRFWSEHKAAGRAQKD